MRLRVETQRLLAMVEYSSSESDNGALGNSESQLAQQMDYS